MLFLLVILHVILHCNSIFDILLISLVISRPPRGYSREEARMPSPFFSASEIHRGCEYTGNAAHFYRATGDSRRFAAAGPTAPLDLNWEAVGLGLYGGRRKMTVKVWAMKPHNEWALSGSKSVWAYKIIHN